MTPVSRLAVRDAICEALWENVKAQDLAEVCVHLGLEPRADSEDPFSSKRTAAALNRAMAALEKAGVQ